MKRKPSPSHSSSSLKKQRTPQNVDVTSNDWPEYFETAINTVLAFVSSKKQLATSFSSIRSSVEGLLKHPLEIAKVSEIKALMPDIVKFSYVRLSDLELNEENSKTFSRNEDYSKAASGKSSNPQSGQVLVLQFADKLNGRKVQNTSSSTLFSGSASSHASLKKLIEARNERFMTAVNELLAATPAGDDPVNLLVTAGRTYVPVNHSSPDAPKEISIPEERATVGQIITDIKGSIWYKDQIVYRCLVSAKLAQAGILDPPISPTIAAAVLQSRNIRALYTHQVDAIQAMRRGKHVVVSTSTASGKSVIYQVPLLACLEEDIHATAMLVFPTKALAQDQKSALEKLIQALPDLSHVKIATYDGDTPQDVRAEIRETAADMLHASILPNEERWRSHVAYILRRFRRVCAAIGSSFVCASECSLRGSQNLIDRRMQFISCSATLANPAEYMSEMFALHANQVEVVSNDGAPAGSKEYLIWNPPFIDVMDHSLGRKSSLSEASNLMRFLMKKGMRVILFCKIRKVCELAMKTIKADLSNEGRLDIVEKIRDRRRIEHEAFSGQLLGIVATNALELGIDIGALDAVIMLGFPITVSNFKQQAGRAGRRSQDSLAIMVVDPFPIDQHFVNNPSDLLENSLDDLVIDLDNEMVLEAHLQCAAYEMPLTGEDEKWFGPSTISLCQKALKKDDAAWFHTHPKFLPFPSRHVSIRGAQEETYMVVEVADNGAQQINHKLEDVEFSRALFELYEGGVFMHQGQTFIVKEISHDSKVAKVVRADVNYITSPRRILPLHTFRILAINQNLVQFGSFFKISEGVVLDAVELLTSPWERETVGFWIDLPNEILRDLISEGIDGAAAIHAAEHAFLNQFALSEDVKTDCRVAKEEYEDAESPAKRPPRLIFYDAAGKTGGVVSRVFDLAETIFNRARMAVDGCQCDDGCSLCVQSTTCKDANLISSKIGARIILNGLLRTNVNNKND
ncbi:DEAD/H helicase [Gymnopilus junonius]|uniref:DEAD/H helicase n=1 Tax=Gymnopilus junonius TaxID=109634 RepID=A0A9P5TQV3_GYMJU|nr:DEAD/H helicase [Gymnopilus junonius]